MDIRHLLPKVQGQKTSPFGQGVRREYMVELMQLMVFSQFQEVLL